MTGIGGVVSSMRDISLTRLVQTAVAGLATAFMTGLASAQTNGTADCGPNATSQCDASLTGFENILSNLFEVVMLMLQYGGFIAFVLGLVLWFTARRSSSRAQYGSWLLLGGILMLVVRFGFDAIISAFRFVAGA